MTCDRVDGAKNWLYNDFEAAVLYSLTMSKMNREMDTDTVEFLYKTWTLKIVHCRVNEFIVSYYQKLADEDNERLRGGQTLRDSLYALPTGRKRDVNVQ